MEPYFALQVITARCWRPLNAQTSCRIQKRQVPLALAPAPARTQPKQTNLFSHQSEFKCLLFACIVVAGFLLLL